MIHNKIRTVAEIWIALACCCFVSPSVAKDSESYLVRYGVFLPAIDTSVRVDSKSLGKGDKVDLINKPFSYELVLGFIATVTLVIIFLYPYFPFGKTTKK